MDIFRFSIRTWAQSWAHPRLRRGPGFPLQSFGYRQKDFRFNPLRVPRVKPFVTKPKILPLGKSALFIFLFLLTGTLGFSLSLTGAEIEAAFRPEYNKSFYYSWDMAVSGSLELNGAFTFSGGIAQGKIRGEPATSLFAAAGYGLPFFRSYFPLNLKAVYMYNSVFEQSTHILLPTVSMQWRYFGFFLGSTLRFTIIDEDSLFEPSPAYLAYVNFFNTEEASGGIGLGNIGEFDVRNRGAYSFYLYNRFGVTKRISVTSGMEIAISGNVGHIASVYGMAFKQGVIFTW
jgi:hypothetical protein